MATLYEVILEFKIKVRTTLHSTPLLCPKTYYQFILYDLQSTELTCNFQDPTQISIPSRNPWFPVVNNVQNILRQSLVMKPVIQGI